MDQSTLTLYPSQMKNVRNLIEREIIRLGNLIPVLNTEGLTPEEIDYQWDNIPDDPITGNHPEVELNNLHDILDCIKDSVDNGYDDLPDDTKEALFSQAYDAVGDCRNDQALEYIGRMTREEIAQWVIDNGYSIDPDRPEIV